MRPVDRARWLARFDMEHLVSAILRNGMLISMGLVLAGLVLQWWRRETGILAPVLQAESLPALILRNLPRIREVGAWPSVCIHLGISVLLLTPYLRVLASLIYFVQVERSWKHALFTGIVLALLTITLLTTLV